MPIRSLIAKTASTVSHSRIPLSIMLAGATIAAVTIGANATFNDTKTINPNIGTGTVSLTLGATGAATNRLNIAAGNIVPGDTIQRAINITNGTATLASLELTTTAPVTSSLLNTDATNGLQMVVDECSVLWTEAGASPSFTYTCAGVTTNRIASRAVIGSNLSIGGAALGGSATGYYRVTLSLPSATGNTFQGLNSTILYSFAGVQRLSLIHI